MNKTTAASVTTAFAFILWVLAMASPKPFTILFSTGAGICIASVWNLCQQEPERKMDEPPQRDIRSIPTMQGDQ